MINAMRRPSRETASSSVQRVIMASTRELPAHSSLKRVAPYPDNLLEDILRMRGLGGKLEAVGYPQFLVKLYRRAMHSRRVMA